MANAARAVLLTAAVCAIAACGGTTQLLGKSAHSSNAQSRAAYLARLNAAQTRLAAAERRIPAHPRTPQALSHAIGLLAVAVQRLAGDLASIHPPALVASAHERLVSIVRTYAGSLTRAARAAASPGGGEAAGRSLEAATSAASQDFSATVAKINTTLGRGT